MRQRLNQTQIAKIESGSEPLKPVVLELRDVTYRSSRERGMRVSEVSMTVRSGELAVIGIEPSLETRGFCIADSGIESAGDRRGLVPVTGLEGEMTTIDTFTCEVALVRVFDDRAWIRESER